MKINNVILAIAICLGLVVAWHVSPLRTPQIIPLDPPVDVPAAAVCTE